jgi:hypothetical protein
MGFLERGLLAVLLVEDGVDDDGEGGEGDVVELVDPGVVDGGAGEVVVEAKPQLRHHQQQVFVEVEQDQLRVLAVALAAVVQHQLPQDLELGDGVVGAEGCLCPFHALDPHAHVGSVDHVDVVGAVPDGESGALVLAHQPDHVLLLLGSDSAADDRPAPVDQLQQQSLLHWGQQVLPSCHQAALPRLRQQVALLDGALESALPLHHCHVRTHQSAGHADVDGRLLLVASQHPHLDPCPADALDCALDVVLQLVLDGGGSDQLQLPLQDLLDILGSASALFAELVEIALDKLFLAFGEEGVVVEDAVHDDLRGFGEQVGGQGLVLDQQLGHSFQVHPAGSALG